MAAPTPPEPVKYFVAILWTDAGKLDLACRDLQAEWGPFDFVGPDHPFDATDYYVPEMGPGQSRRLVGFAQLQSPELLAHAKLRCNALEDAFASSSGRTVNLDIGYLDHGKIVLGTAKGAGQKIYLSQGIYADLVARFKGGRYHPFEWTFPDFKQGRYDAELLALRAAYLLARRKGRTAPGERGTI